MGNSGSVENETTENLKQMMKDNTGSTRTKKIPYFLITSPDWPLLKPVVLELCKRGAPYRGTNCLCP